MTIAQVTKTNNKVAGMKRSSITQLWASLIIAVLGIFADVGQSAAGETVTYYHVDALGSPVAATNSSGDVIWREEYDAYGDRIRKEGSTNNNLWYTGKFHEQDIGLTYFGARWYDPVVCRFMGIDPVEFQEGNIHSFNRYAYANNNPYKFVDPDGRSALTKAVKLALNGGDVAATFADVVKDGATVFNPAAPTSARLYSAISVLSELAPISVGDIKDAAKLVAKESQAASKVFSTEKQALVDMAKGDKKAGVTRDDMKAYEDLNKGLPDPFPSNKVRLDAGHSGGAPHSQVPHGHVGPVDHIPVLDP